MKFSICGFLAALMLVFLFSCSDNDHLFVLKSPEKTGINFSNQITESDSFNILTDEYIFNGAGIAVADFNNDGLQDLFFTGNQVSNKLYLNEGDFNFKDISSIAGIEASGSWCTGTTAVDINGDGWMDIYVATAMLKGVGERNNLLFVNQGTDANGDLSFVEQAAIYGIADAGNSMGASFIDYDLDGDLDLYVLNNEQSKVTPSNYREKITDGSAINNDAFYRNNGDGTFTDVTIDTGITIEGFGLGLVVADLNNDGWPDIHVSNDYVTNDILYINNQDGTFSNQSKAYLRHQSQFSMGSDISDFNNDAKPDLITIDMLGEDNFRKKTTIGKNSYQVYISNEQWGYEYQYVRNMLHLNNGDGIPFSEIGLLAGIYQTDWSWAPLFGDVDNDGFRDLLITNGFPRDITDKDFANYRADVGGVASTRQLLDSIPIVKIPNYAYKNNGDLTFQDAGQEWGLAIPSFSNGAAYVDLDLDGDLDYVVNNINDPAFIFENTLNDGKEKPNYLRIKLIGTASNPIGLGAKLKLNLSDGTSQYQEQQIVRGFMSSIDPVIHFGLGKSNSVKNLLVIWPDGKESSLENPASNQVLEINYKEAKTGKHTLAILEDVKEEPIYEEVSANLGLNFFHEEQDKVDFNIQRTIPHKLSQYGPALAAGDVNGDQLEDLIIGSSSGFAPKLYLQKPDGTFEEKSFLEGESNAFEEIGMLLFDLDNDGDLDLYLVSGSSEFIPDAAEYVDRIYLNDGKGNFSINKDFLGPKASGSVVRAADFNGDGFLDLFVGGRSPIGKYPVAEQSFLLKNTEGVLRDVSEEIASGLKHIGMVTDAIWSDIDQDGKVDLVVVGELMAISIFKNDGVKLTKLENSGLENHLGWWNSIISGDFDQDGDTDFVVGNLGKNNPHHPTFERPLKIYAKDFDGNGSMDPVTFAYYKDRSGNFNSYPSHFWDDLYGQSILFRKKYERYKSYALSTENDIFTEMEKEGAMILVGNYDESAFIRNNGDGTFEVVALPIEAQFAPVNGLVSQDVNKDGFLDVMLIGNDYGNEIFTGRLDALIGLVLLGDGNGNFNSMAPSKSGFLVAGDGKALIKLATAEGKPLVIATQNRGSLAVFKERTDSSELKSIFPSALTMAIVFELESGKMQRVETGYGSGFLSQSSREVQVPTGTKSITMIDYNGKSSPLNLASID